MRERLLGNLVERCRVRPNDVLVVACSGGADSVALALLLLQLRDDLPLRLHLAHLDHALRPGSRADAEFVADLADRFDLQCHQTRIEVERERAPGENLEAAARRIRRGFLRRVADRVGADKIALAHHCRDQAETILFRLIRGAGTAGLTGMAWCDSPFVRPLLDFDPDELRAWLRGIGQGWREDPSNNDLDLSRNRLRHQVLPMLQTINRRAVEHLAALGERISVDESYWHGQVDVWLDEQVSCEGGDVVFDVRALRLCHPALRMRVWLEILRRVAGRQVDLGETHLFACDGLLFGASQADCHLPGLWVGRRYDRILVGRQQPVQAEPWQLEIAGPGRHPLPDGSLLLVEIVDEAGELSTDSVAFDLASLDFPLTIRTRRPGDRFVPEGARGERKLKDVFIDAKIPREQRNRLPLLVSKKQILWVVGFQRSSLFCPVAGQKVLRLSLHRPVKP